VVVRAMVLVVLCVVMAVVVVVVVRTTQDRRRDEVDQKADGGDGHGLRVVDGLGCYQPLDGAEHHHRRHDQQEYGARESPQDLDLPGAECEARIARVPAGGGVGEGAQADRDRVRAHVPAVGQQRHRVVEPARGDLDHHRRGGEPHHRPGAALARAVAGVKHVLVRPPGKVMGMHGPNPHHPLRASILRWR